MRNQVPLQYWLFTPEIQWQSRDKTAYLTGRGVATKGYLYVYIHTVYRYPFGVCHTGRGVATKGYLYVYIHTVYRYPFGVSV